MPLSNEVIKYCDHVRGVKKQGDMGTLCPGRCVLKSICRESPTYPLTIELMNEWHHKMNNHYHLMKKHGHIGASF